MNCIIIDDDATARLIVKQLCVKTKCLSLIDEFSSAIEAVKYLNSNDIDLIFLDIHMPNFSGFDYIRTLKNPSKIILTTSDKKYALEAFEYDFVIDYLVKPLSIERFNKSIHKLKLLKSEELFNSEKKSTENFDYIYVNIEKRLVKICIPEIFLIEAKGDYINIKTSKKNYIVHSTLTKIENKLPEAFFLRVHRSFVINTSEIIDIENNSVLIKNNVVPISRSNKSKLMIRLNML